jgi:hypothetical protein
VSWAQHAIAPPQTAITDLHRLPEWNNRAAVLEEPVGPLAEGVEWLAEGVEWKVRMSVPPAKWVSHARVLR